jgi:hypothetical protein
MLPLRRFVPALLLAGVLAAQADTITEERVRATVGWLAADERNGRDTGSPEIVVAGEWIAERFAKAGLAKVVGDSWYHEFPMGGWQVDGAAATATLVRRIGDKTTEFALQPGVDVRQWTVADTAAGTDEACTVALFDDEVLQRLLQAGSSRRPVFCEVEESHPFWAQAGAPRQVLGQRRQASRPLFLVKKGALPKGAASENAQWSATWTVAPPTAADAPQRNVVAMLPGGAKKDEFVVVSAHYDHVGTGRAVDGDAIYNGADDDATGTTAVLLLAESLAKQGPLPRTVVFVCFTAEERGLLGSKAFCEKPPFELGKVVANVNLEMLGRPEVGKEGKAWVTGADLSDFAAIVGESLRKAGVETIEFPMASRLFAASDNWSFARAGVVAHSISAGSLHRDYHQPDDEADRLDIAHMTKVIVGLREVVVDLASRDAAPQWNDAGKKRIAPRGR